MIPWAEIPPDKLEGVATKAISARPAFFLGPYFIGMMIDAVLFGVLIQLYIKWHMYSMPEERKIVRYLVWFIMLFGIGCTVFIITWIFKLFVYGFGTYSQFMQFTWMSWLFVLPTFGRLPVSAFFAHRAYELLGRNKIFLVIISLLLTTVAATSIATKATYNNGVEMMLRLVIVSTSTETVADLIVTVTIAVCLFKSKTGWSATDKLIHKLLFLVVETQLPPTILTIVYLILFSRIQTRLLTTFTVCAPKVYDLSLMLTLVSRQKLRRDLSVQQDYPLSHMSKDGGTPTLPYANQTHIHVTTETTTHVQRSTLARPKFSINRSPPEEDLHVQLEHDGVDDDKDSWEGKLNSSEVRLTKAKEDA